MNAAQYILIFGIRLYQWVISPAKTFVLGPLSHCRFTPSCSVYAVEAIARHGALAGSWLALKRIGRCHPWGGCGHDPVPEPRSKVQRPKSKGQRPKSAAGSQWSVVSSNRLEASASGYGARNTQHATHTPLHVSRITHHASRIIPALRRAILPHGS